VRIIPALNATLDVGWGYGQTPEQQSLSTLL
jgi:hypothetical protein